MNVITFMALFFTIPKFFSEFYELDQNLDPLYLLKKNNVDPSDENAWKVVANEVKEIMMFMTGMRGSEQGYQELLEYEKTEVYVKDTMGGTLMRRTGCVSKRDDSAQQVAQPQPTAEKTKAK